MRRCALPLALWLLALCGAVCVAQVRLTAEEFPQVAARIPHFAERIASADEDVRMRVITELTYFNPRDSVRYPPFFLRLLQDPSPAIRWQALSRLDDHGITVAPSALPHAVAVPLVGVLDRTSAESLAMFRAVAAGKRPPAAVPGKSSVADQAAAAGWAIKALGLLQDKEALPLAQQLLRSENLFTRHAAAVALTQLGAVDQGIAALATITGAADDPSACYRASAAERLYRLGKPQYLATLLACYRTRAEYADRLDTILADLTGEYFLTEADWRAWWEKTGETVRRT